jgi:hypothetical protein
MQQEQDSFPSAEDEATPMPIDNGNAVPQAHDETAAAPAPTEWGPEQQAAAEYAFAAQVDRLARYLPEAKERGEDIAKGGAELIESFQVKPEFFGEPMRSTLFASLSLHAAGAARESDRNGMTDPEVARKRQFVASAAFLLTRGFSDAHPELAAAHEKAEQSSHNIERETMDKFEHPELTSALATYIEESDLLDELKARLGDNGDVPDYRVLSIGHGNAALFAKEQNGLDYETIHAWDRGLVASTKRFAQMVPGGEVIAQASGYAVDFEDDGHHTVYMPAAKAEVLMAEQRGVKLSQYTELAGVERRVQGVVRHEFVHAQNPVLVGANFGRSLEERRAEYFSGDTGEYYDVKSFFRQLDIVCGASAGSVFETALASQDGPMPVSPYEVYAAHGGLELVAEVAASQPESFAKFTASEAVTDMHAALGGCEGIIDRAARSLPDKRAAEGRLIQGINRLRAINSKDGQLNTEYEEFIGSYFQPVLKGLGMELADIAYVPSAAY